MIEDFVNWTPEKCKRIIHEYQRTKNKELFSLLLAKYDTYLVKLVWEFRDYFQEEELEDLYHTAVLGFGNALLRFKEHIPARLIMAVIRKHVKEEFNFDRINERKYECEGLDRVSDDREEIDNVITIDLIMNSSLITEKEKELLSLRYLQGMKLKDVAIKKNISLRHTQRKIKKALEKIRKEIKQKEK